MDIIQAISLAILQGLTEFLPISSSAHLILLPKLLGWEDQGVAFDVAVHIGTLLAVVTYYRKDITILVIDWYHSLQGKGSTDESKLAWFVILGTLPVALVGLSLSDQIVSTLRSPYVIATSTIVFALLLAWSEKTAKERRNVITWKDCLVVSLMQALALIPGTSRSGITISAGLMSGLTRKQAARFSFLLSIPTITSAGLLKTFDLLNSTDPVMWDLMLVGAALSCIIAYLSIAWFLKLLEKTGMMPFVWYRLLLGVYLLALFY